MDVIRLGLSLRALRRRRGWTLAEVAARTQLSAATLSRMERGAADRFSLRTIVRVAGTLGAALQLRVLWQGEELDRLLDRAHARLVEEMIRRLILLGWIVEPEVTYQVNGERGSIDILATHPATGSLVVMEVKSTVPDLQALLAGMDRKARLAPAVAAGRGWRSGPVSRILVLPDDRTARRRIAAFGSTFNAALPDRTVALKRWLANPDRVVAGVLFVTNVNPVQPRHRVRRPPARDTHGRAQRS